MRVVSSGPGAEPGHDSETVRARTARVEALTEDAQAVLTTVRASSTSAAAWPVTRDGAAAGVPAAATALLDAVAAVCEAATTALTTQAEQLREQAARARAIDADTADRLHAIGRDRGDDVRGLHAVPVHGPHGGGGHGGSGGGGNHGGGNNSGGGNNGGGGGRRA